MLLNPGDCRRRRRKRKAKVSSWESKLKKYVNRVIKSGIGPLNQYTDIPKNLRNEQSKASSIGMVVADDSRCARVAKYQLQKGGNAIDAAVAAQFCLSVIDMQSTG